MAADPKGPSGWSAALEKDPQNNGLARWILETRKHAEGVHDTEINSPIIRSARRPGEPKDCRGVAAQMITKGSEKAWS